MRMQKLHTLKKKYKLNLITNIFITMYTFLNIRLILINQVILLIKRKTDTYLVFRLVEIKNTQKIYSALFNLSWTSMARIRIDFFFYLKKRGHFPINNIV